jgi:hypothetical protein
MIDYDHSALVFDEDYLSIPEMQVFGCEPDYNAFTMSANETPMPPQPGFRSAAAHVHIGWANPSDEDRLELIRLCDVFVTCRFLREQTESDAKRRQLYGKAGAFRPKNYGVEHRVLSNSWQKNHGTIDQTLKGYQDAIAALNAGLSVDEDDYARIAEAINGNHPKLAVLLHTKYNKRLVKALGPSFSMSSYYRMFM